MTRTNGTSGPRVAAGLLLIIAVAGATILYFWNRGRVPRGDVLAELSAPELPGTLLIRKGYKQRGFVHLVHEVDGQLQWKAALFGYQDPIAYTVGDDLLTLRTTSARGGYETVAYLLSDGAFSWRTRPFAPEKVLEPWKGPRSIAKENTLVEIYDGPPFIVVIARKNGEELSRTPFVIAPGKQTVSFEGEKVVVRSGSQKYDVAMAEAQ